jgi:hypothetical protein
MEYNITNSSIKLTVNYVLPQGQLMNGNPAENHNYAVLWLHIHQQKSAISSQPESHQDPVKAALHCSTSIERATKPFLH